MLRQALRRHGGDEFGMSGDGMFMAFSEPDEAVTAALEVQRSFADIRLGNGTALRVRMGLHTGPAVPDAAEGFVGLTVPEAARIMSAAHGGQVLFSARTASLVPSANTWNLGTFLLKDIEEPMELHGSATTISRPTSLLSGRVLRFTGVFPTSSLPELFVGRSLELESLLEAWHTSRTGRMGAALVGGEAGIGKTALVGRLAIGAYGEGATVLYGRSRKGLTVPYQSFADALTRWTASASDDDLGGIGIGGAPTCQDCCRTSSPGSASSPCRPLPSLGCTASTNCRAFLSCSPPWPPPLPFSSCSTTCSGPMPRACNY